jgi:hypothetical protein
MSLVVRCRENTLSSTPTSFLDDRRGYRPSTVLPLSVGAMYVVFAITSFVGGFWYYVLDDDGHSYPIWYPAPVFDVVSERVPSGWVLGHHRVGGGGVTSILTFPAWASDPHFYEKLVDDEPTAVAVFDRVRDSLSMDNREGRTDE